MPKSTRLSRPGKPCKPSRDFPLFAHAAGVWAKKVRQRLHYFGPWNDPDGALKRWLEQKDDLLAGGTPDPETDGIAIRDLANRFLTAKKHLVDTGEITPRTYSDDAWQRPAARWPWATRLLACGLCSSSIPRHQTQQNGVAEVHVADAGRVLQATIE
jgi:hypothetical protein